MESNKERVNSSEQNFIQEIKSIILSARHKSYSAINFAQVEAYWQIGKRIVEEEQHGKNRAAYGEEILKTLSVELTKEFGKGFGSRNLWYFRQFYLTFRENEIMHTLCSQLSWSHIRLIIKLSDKNAQPVIGADFSQYKDADKNQFVCNRMHVG